MVSSNSSLLILNSLVSSKLDYCNSLCYNLPSSSISGLQRVQNSLARVVFPTVKRTDHISPILHELHWLPITQRITFKIALLTFKTITCKEPFYWYTLLTPYSPSRNLRSSNKHLLVVPKIKSAQGQRSFHFAAPTIWNSLPLHLRTSTSVSSFRSHLKAYLYPP